MQILQTPEELYISGATVDRKQKAYSTITYDFIATLQLCPGTKKTESMPVACVFSRVKSVRSRCFFFMP